MFSLIREANLNAWQFVTRQEIRAGEEVTVSYGNRNNRDLTFTYGFVERLNPFDEIGSLFVPTVKGEREVSVFWSGLDCKHHEPEVWVQGEERDLEKCYDPDCEARTCDAARQRLLGDLGRLVELSDQCAAAFEASPRAMSELCELRQKFESELQQVPIVDDHDPESGRKSSYNTAYSRYLAASYEFETVALAKACFDAVNLHIKALKTHEVAPEFIPATLRFECK